MNKKVLTLVLPLLLSLFALVNTAFIPLKDHSKLVHNYSFKTFNVKIFKSESLNNPYNIKITCSKTAMFRDFMVIENNNEDFKYILIEKVGAKYTYFPVAWQKLDLICVNDLKDYCNQILAEELKCVDKSFVEW